MKSTFSLVAVALLAFSHVVVAKATYPAAALKYRQFKTQTYEGCYSSSDGLTMNDTWKYQSKGYCQGVCVPLGKPVQAQSNGDECWCGDSVPPSSAKVDDSNCNSNCTGYGVEMCGGNGFFSVYLDGLTDADKVPNAVQSAGATPSASSKPKTSSTTSATPSVVTIGGQTVVVTAPPSSSASAGGSSKSSGGGGPNKAAIAAGVVVGIVIIAALAGGIFLFIRHRRRRAIEEEHRRNAAVSSFIGVGKPASSGGASSFTDTRLDPVMANRRLSDGSIADNQDYSRRILKVTNA